MILEQVGRTLMNQTLSIETIDNTPNTVDLMPINLQINQEEQEVLKSIQKKVHAIANHNGWHANPREIGTLIALCHSELSEALEGARKNQRDSHLPHRSMLEVELADCIIRILDMAELLGLNVAAALAEKSIYNFHRQDHKYQNRQMPNGKKF